MVPRQSRRILLRREDPHSQLFPLMASSCSAGLWFYGCPHVRLWRGAAAWQLRSWLWVIRWRAVRGYLLLGFISSCRTLCSADQNRQRLQKTWASSSSTWTSVCNQPFPHSRRRRPDGGMHLCQHDACLLSLLLELLRPNHRRFQSFSVSEPVSKSKAEKST